MVHSDVKLHFTASLAKLHTNLMDTKTTHAPTPVSCFGKDHWSLLAYVESRCVDGNKGVGTLARPHLRANPATHPLLAHATPTGWKDTYSTRLKGFFAFDERADVDKAMNAGLMLRGHDDWDCLDDLQDAGFVEILSLANGQVRMTDAGLDAAAQLRRHKARGGMFASFELEPVAAA